MIRTDLLLIWCRLMPESPRWMLTKGRKAETIAYFKHSAKMNKIEIPKNLDVYLEAMVCSKKNCKNKNI